MGTEFDSSMAVTLCISKIVPIHRTNRSSIEFALLFRLLILTLFPTNNWKPEYSNCASRCVFPGTGKIVYFLQTFRPVQKPLDSRIRWVQGALSLRFSWGVELTSHLHPVPRLKMSGATGPLILYVLMVFPGATLRFLSIVSIYLKIWEFK